LEEFTDEHYLPCFIPAVSGFSHGSRPMLRSLVESGMNAEYLIALLDVMGLMVYLITALIIPEDFS
jgi:hypothetical protein